MDLMATKERPILMSAPMVRATLAGTKTQTRRIVRKQFPGDAVVAEVAATTPEGWQVSGHSGLWWDDAGACIDDAVPCPYGVPGDRLWVREAHSIRVKPDEGVNGVGGVWYREGSPWAYDDRVKWSPSIHMPRWASRITLEITGVRVERLQDISVKDAMAEGVIECSTHLAGLGPCMEWRYAFEDLWESINGRGSWDANPWVWVVEFKRIS